MAYFIIGILMIVSIFNIILKSKAVYITVVINKSTKKINVGVLLSFCILLFIMVFQSETSNGDLMNYLNSYNRMGALSYKNFILNFIAIKDPVYHFVGKLFHSVNLSFFWWKFAISFFYCFSAFRLILKYSSNYTISVIIFCTLGYYSFCFSALRQIIAISFILLSYDYIKEKKFIKFALFVFFAACFHYTAFIFIISYPIYNKLKVDWKNILIFLISGTAMYILGNRVLSIVFMFLTGRRFASYAQSNTTLNISGFIIFGCILIFYMFYSVKIKPLENNNVNIIYFLIIGTFIRLMATYLAELFRVAMYFDIFCIIAVPEACTSEKEYKILVSMLISLLFVIYYFYSPDGNLSNHIFYSI